MSIEVVPIAESHAEGFHACLDAVARERRWLAQVEALPLERVRAFVRESVESGTAQFVALDDERVVGWCDILPHWAHAVRHRGSVGMGLLPSYRGRGIGRALLSVCLAKARANGIVRVDLEVRADNEHAIHLYERMGFARDALARRGMRFDDVYFDTLAMSLVFDTD